MLRFCFAAALLAAAAGALAQEPPGPPAFVDAWYQWILRWVMTPIVGPALLGLVSSWVFTQRYKMNLPLDLDSGQRRRKTQRFSFVAAFVPSFVLWPLGFMWNGLTGQERYLLFVSALLGPALVGCASPFLYTIVMGQLYKRGWLDETRWSGESRAEAKRTGQLQDPPPELL